MRLFRHLFLVPSPATCYHSRIDLQWSQTSIAGHSKPKINSVPFFYDCTPFKKCASTRLHHTARCQADAKISLNFCYISVHEICSEGLRRKFSRHLKKKEVICSVLSPRLFRSQQRIEQNRIIKTVSPPLIVLRGGSFVALQPTRIEKWTFFPLSDCCSCC